MAPSGDMDPGAPGAAAPPASTGGQRVGAAYQSHDAGFTLKKGTAYDKQYSQIYFMRLSQLRPEVKKAAEQRWPDAPVLSILDVEEGVECSVIGTVFKQMKLKPSVLSEYKDGDPALNALVGDAKFTAADDSVVLEDEGSRMVLEGAGGALPVGDLVTGLVMAVRGKEVAGVFQVAGVAFAGLPDQSPRPALREDKYVALVSGLALGAEGGEALGAQLLVDYLSGNLGGDADAAFAQRVARLVVAGDSVHVAADNSVAPRDAAAGARMLAPVQELDLLLTQAAAAMPVDLMPGPRDPSNVSLPQQPIHPCLLPSACCYSTFHRATNPHTFAVDGVEFLGTSGQNVDDLFRYSTGEDRLALMARTLECRHLAPTAPDTLGCYPYWDREPFILRASPHVLFCGNQPAFGERTVRGPGGQEVKLVALPRFRAAGEVVLLNLKDLSCELLKLDLDAIASAS